MNRIDIVKAAFDFDNPDSASLLSDDFQSTDAVGGPPMDRSMWIGMGQIMRASIPDASYIIEDIREEGDGVTVTGRFSGTFVNDFDLSAMGMGVIPATGAAVDFPDSTSQVSFNGDKISRVHDPDTGPNAGMQGFLKALGADMG